MSTIEERAERWQMAEDALGDAWMVLWHYTEDYPEIAKVQGLIEQAQSLLDFAFQKYGR